MPTPIPVVSTWPWEVTSTLTTSRHINLVEEQVKTQTQAYEDIKTLLSQPFTDKMLAIKALEGFKMPVIEAYDGLFDPANHLH